MGRKNSQSGQNRSRNLPKRNLNYIYTSLRHLCITVAIYQRGI